MRAKGGTRGTETINTRQISHYLSLVRLGYEYAIASALIYLQCEMRFELKTSTGHCLHCVVKSWTNDKMVSLICKIKDDSL